MISSAIVVVFAQAEISVSQAPGNPCAPIKNRPFEALQTSIAVTHRDGVPDRLARVLPAAAHRPCRNPQGPANSLAIEAEIPCESKDLGVVSDFFEATDYSPLK